MPKRPTVAEIQRVSHERRFYMHLARNTAFALGMAMLALFVGSAGYHYTEGLPWLDAVLNASMILTGMGPVDRVQSDAGKVFATLYALFSGIVFLSTAALVLLPVAHRVLHRFHLELENEEH
jgi:hypothetical protein